MWRDQGTTFNRIRLEAGNTFKHPYIAMCPFCHWSAVVDEVDDRLAWQVGCQNCAATGPVSAVSPQDAINLWNIWEDKYAAR